MKLSVLLILVLLSFGCKECVESHTERVYRPAWTQYICASYGKSGMCTMWVPIFHQAKYETVKICDRYEK
jgi:hypothetical protein